jgi:tetratricopeptide (TPR) repeat protein
MTAEDAEAHLQYARFLWYMGRVAEALPFFRRARELDPYSAQASGWHGHMLFLRGDRDQGLAEMRRAVEIDSTNPPAIVFLASSLRALGQPDEARLLIQRLWRVVPTWRGIAVNLEDPPRVKEILREFQQRVGHDPHANTRLAMMYAELGDSTGFFDALERATAAGEIWPTYFSLSEPFFDFVRGSGRFAEIVRRVGLDVGTFTSPTGGRLQ